MPDDGKMYTAKSVKENGNYLDVEWEEIVFEEPKEELPQEVE